MAHAPGGLPAFAINSTMFGDARYCKKNERKRK